MGDEGALMKSAPQGRGSVLWPLGLTCAVLLGPVRAGPAGLGSAQAPPARAGGPQVPWHAALPAAGTALRDREGLGLSTAPTAPLGGLLHPTRAFASPQNHCQCLPSLCRSSCRVLARISATWRSWASRSSRGGSQSPCSGSGCRGGSPCGTRVHGQEGLTPSPGEP